MKKKTPPSLASVEKISTENDPPKDDKYAKREAAYLNAKTAELKDRTKERQTQRTRDQENHEFIMWWRPRCLCAAFLFVVVWYTVVVIAVVWSKGLGLSDAVLIAMLTTASANVVGVALVIVNYFFQRGKLLPAPSPKRRT